MTIIRKFCEKISDRVTIGVVGDGMIDEYYDVSVSRISPEFPIPVMKSPSTSSKDLPGGAGNVVRQFRNFNVETRLSCLTGERFESLLHDEGIDIRNLIFVKDMFSKFTVPLKRRFYDGDFPIQRWDVEKVNYGLDSFDLDKNLAKMRGVFESDPRQKPDMLILSNYDKGVFTSRAEKSWWLNRGIPTLVDPKCGDPSHWNGCTIFKPNAAEAFAMTGHKDWKDQCRKLLFATTAEHVVITDGGSAVYGLSMAGDFFRHESESKSPPRSVVGAGDCFAAFLAMAYCRGFGIEDASEIAFKAGQAYVKAIHNEPLTIATLLRPHDPLYAKMQQISPADGKKVVFTNGCFDLLHVGHVAGLMEAKKHGDILVVGVNDDESVTALKGSGRPVVPLSSRMEMLAALECVDCVIPFSGTSPLDLIREVKPDVLVKGEDWKEKTAIGADEVAEVVYVPLREGTSTSAIIKKIVQ